MDSIDEARSPMGSADSLYGATTGYQSVDGTIVAELCQTVSRSHGIRVFPLLAASIGVVLVVKPVPRRGVDDQPPSVSQVAQGLCAGVHKVVMGRIWEAADLADKALRPVPDIPGPGAGLGDPDPPCTDDVRHDGQALHLVGPARVVGSDGHMGTL